MKQFAFFVLFAMLFAAFATPLFMLPAHATTPHNGVSAPDGISVISLPTSTDDDADYSISCPGDLSGCTVPSGTGTSWGATIFSVTYTGTVAITITDCCYEGDYYQLWSTTDSTGLTGWTLIATTDQVDTGSELAASTFDSYWTGTGTQYSSTTFNIPMSGTVLFAVRDVLFDQMVSLLGPSCSGALVVTDGCTATGISASGGWSPAGFGITFAAASSAGCLDGSGDTSWPTVTFTDGSTADVSVSGGVLAAAGTCASMSIEDLFTSQPGGTTDPGVTNPNYYDLSILGLTAGTAHVCFTSSLVTSTTVMKYWNGNSWTTVSSTFTSPHTICGDIPVTALATESTPVVIGTSSGPVTGVPQFPGGFGLLAVAVSFALLALMGRKFGLGQGTRTPSA